MSLNNVQSALQCVYRNFLPASIPIAEENKKFDPPKNKVWSATRFIPNTPYAVTLGEDGYDRYSGLFQIDMNFAVGSGTAQARQFYEDAKTQIFYIGARYTAAGQDVTINSFGRTLGQSVGNFFRVVYTVSWTADIFRRN